ncbi:MAG: hypothetical protein LAT75_06950 [Candidatus Cyclonatronum sp.]|uniref:hypothetical protein n=1 Tax=Cyclonatronum sp. TaxID=3024185 RepID=UPI0025BBCD86|nr:hypothetical protein [Cyclonatronum sp.]MCH8486586.1 hypothetical protein [Cyclonatronum sp.]
MMSFEKRASGALAKAGTFFRQIAENPALNRAKPVFSRLVLFLILGLVGWQLYSIGITEILKNLPVHPLFYILFVLTFFSLPLAEVFIYRQVWDVPRRHLFGRLLKKKVFNDEVAGYSGEVFLSLWAKNYLGLGHREAIKNVRDNNILSALSNNSAALLLLGGISVFGIVDLSSYFGEVSLWQWVAGGLAAVLLTGLFFSFRRYLFALPAKKAAKVFSIYFSRFILHNGMMIMLWAVVIPEVAFQTWLLFVTVMIVLNRIPLLPSRDLVFLMVGIELSKTFEVATASMAGMLLVYSALKKGTNLGIYLWLSWREKKRAKEAAGPVSEP